MRRPACHSQNHDARYACGVAQPAGLPRAGFRQSPWRGRLRTGLIVFLALCVLLVGSSYFYFRHQLSRLTRLDIPGLASDDDTGSVMNVLMVGSDSRENTTGYIADATGKGDEGTTGQRSDTIMILHVDPTQQKAAILSVPRDLYVPIPGNGKDKVNSAFSIGGPELLIRTIKGALGIDINHYVEIDFTGFERIVDTIGGVKVYTDFPARDEMTGLDLPLAGCNEVDGYQALAFVRSRYYETYERGRWVSGANSDIDRISRQQDFIRRIMKKAVSSGLGNPLTLNRLISIGVSNVRVDQAMSTKDITTLAKRFRSIDPDTVDMLTLPTSDGFAGDAAIQLLDMHRAQEYIDRLNGVKAAPPPSSVKPGEVAVTVLNGNGGDAVATTTAASLTQAGFRVAATGNALSYDYRQTIVQYAPGKQDKGALLRSTLVAGAALEEDKTLTTSDVTLVVGLDYNGVKSSATTVPAAAASTAPAVGAPTTTIKAPAPAC
jgi:polyisoprenyl-teichoic acid--peptidoglycan teichoic acid transferase